MVEKVAFTMIPIVDTARARAFYEGKLGLPLGMHAPNGVWTEYDLPGGGCIALFRGGGPPSGGGAVVALEVRDLDALAADLRASGVPFDSDFVRGPRCRMVTVRDPEGNALLLHQRDR